MSGFRDAMASANEALLAATGDPMEYWPGGIEDDARDIDVIWTDYSTNKKADGMKGEGNYSKAEAQIWADDTRGMESPNVELDVIRKDGLSWVVMEILESVAGMHRLAVERVKQAQVGRGRGRGFV